MNEEVSNGTGFGRDKDAPEGGRFKGRKRRKVSYLTIQKIHYVDYKEIAILRRFVNERGKMISSRQTGNTAKQQRMIARAIRRARELALLPFVLSEPPADTRSSGFRRDRRDRPYDTPMDSRDHREPRETRERPSEAPVEKSASVEVATEPAVEAGE